MARQAAASLESLHKAIAVCKETLVCLERTTSLLASFIESDHLKLDDTLAPPARQSRSQSSDYATRL